MHQVVLCDGCSAIAKKIARRIGAKVVSNCGEVEGRIVGCPALKSKLPYEIVDLRMIESKFRDPEKVAIAWINSSLIQRDYETEIIDVGDKVVYVGNNPDVAFELANVAEVTVVTQDTETIKSLYPFHLRVIKGELRSVKGKIGDFTVIVKGLDLASNKKVNKIKAGIVIAPKSSTNKRREGLYLYGNEYEAALKAINRVGKVVKVKAVEVKNELCGAIKSNIPGCSLCLDCPTNSIVRVENGVSVNFESCVGCGFCSSICPLSAIENKTLPSDLLSKKIDAALQNGSGIVAFICENALGEFFIYDGKLPPILPVIVPCINSVSEFHYLYALTKAEGVIAVPCDCEHLKTDCLEIANASLEAFGLDGVKLTKIGEIENAVKQIKEKKMRLAQYKELREKAVEGKNKRERWLNLVLNMKSLGLPLVKEEFSLKGFGKIEIGENCTLCQACTSFCPSEAIERDIEEGKLKFTHGLCIGCELCVKVCPEDAIKSETLLNFGMLRETTVFEDEMLRCIYCGKHFMSKRAYSKIKKTAELDKTLLFCPECRPKAILESIYDEMMKERSENAKKMEDEMDGSGNK